MKDQKKNLKNWTLFLDRDGVINVPPKGRYIFSAEEFEFVPLFLKIAKKLSQTFDKIVVATNQQGVGLGLIPNDELLKIHRKLLEGVSKAGGRIDKIYCCTHNAADGCDCRKPLSGMATQAKKDFPDIDFKRSVMVGDSISDIQFGEKMGMKTVLVKVPSDLNKIFDIIKL